MLLAVLALIGRADGRSRIALHLTTLPRVRAEWIVVMVSMGLAVAVSYASQAAFAAR